MTGLAGLTMMSAAALPASPGLAADMAAPLLSPAVLVQPAATETLAAMAEPDAPLPDANQPDVTEVECMAKVVMHEAGNQPYDGKVAVAQTLVNRKADGRFGGSICEVVNQRGQFFNTAAYNPDRGGENWNAAMRVAHAVLTGGADAVAPGAMFFRAAYSPASSFFRSRKQVASVGAHIFYR